MKNKNRNNKRSNLLKGTTSAYNGFICSLTSHNAYSAIDNFNKDVFLEKYLSEEHFRTMI